MSNMGYCRFQNTLRDLQNCLKHIDDKLSTNEQNAKNNLIELCIEIVEECANENEYNDE